MQLDRPGFGMLTMMPPASVREGAGGGLLNGTNDGAWVEDYTMAQQNRSSCKDAHPVCPPERANIPVETIPADLFFESSHYDPHLPEAPQQSNMH